MKELIEIQSELKAPKNQYNKYGEFNYRSCEDILEALKPLLHKYKCYLTLSDSVEFVGNRHYIKATCKIVNSEKEFVEVSALAREQQERKKMDDSQLTGSASSYARKYALNGLFAIDDTKEADSKDNSDKIKIDDMFKELKESDLVEDRTFMIDFYKKSKDKMFEIYKESMDTKDFIKKCKEADNV